MPIRLTVYLSIGLSVHLSVSVFMSEVYCVIQAVQVKFFIYEEVVIDVCVFHFRLMG